MNILISRELYDFFVDRTFSDRELDILHRLNNKQWKEGGLSPSELCITWYGHNEKLIVDRLKRSLVRLINHEMVITNGRTRDRKYFISKLGEEILK